MTKTHTPSFPSWNDVAISLFLNGSWENKSARDASMKNFLELISHIPENYTIPLSGVEQIALTQHTVHKRKLALSVVSEKEVKSRLSKLPMSSNQFYIVGDSTTTEFAWVSENTKDLMGLKANEDFTFMKVCGMDDRDELYHPEDVEHLIRFGTCVWILISIVEFQISPFTDYYEVNFRTGWSEETKCKTMRRRCFVSNRSEGAVGARHIDTWRVTDGHDRFNHLHWELHFSDPKINTLINGMFFILNCVLIGITPQEAVLANLLALHEAEYKDILNKEIAKALGQTDFQYENQQTYFNQKSQLKKKIDKLIFNTTKGSAFRSNPSSTGLQFRCGQMGIVGMSKNLQESIWKNVT